MKIYVSTVFTLVLLSFIATVIKCKQVQTFNKDVEKPCHLSIDEDYGDKSTSYEINDVDGLSRRFDGIGGLSGGGATSRLLVNYQEPYRSQILDFLFKPQFGASLHILKVEIGGDAQSTEGTEHSHMHTESDENYTRGYEWWLMKEAKIRNPNIKLVGLPWGWPGWIGQGKSTPYTNTTLTTTYIAKWINGAKVHHNLTIDYVGIWNEKPYDVGYIKELRIVLNSYEFGHVKIIASDGSFNGISEAILSDAELAKAVDVIGAHYPGTYSTKDAIKTTKQLWASEDYSTFNDLIGGGCWARLLNQNYVNGNMTSTISWNLIASYYDNLPFKRCSLMTANEPWSGHYEITSPLWVTAHTTQFVQPGWFYLHTVGHLQSGGSYVALTDGKGNLTIIIETMTHDHSICIRPPLPPYSVQEQNASFTLGGSFLGQIKKLNVWQSQLEPSSTEEQMFVKKGSLSVDGQGHFDITLPTDVVVTLSTISSATKGSYQTPPSSAPFPFPYSENFNPTSFSEAFNFADQAGAFETFHNESGLGGHDWTLRQVVTQHPVTWCDEPDLALSYVGDYSWANINATVRVKIEGTSGVFLALRVNEGGCQTRNAKGLFLWLNESGEWVVTSDLVRTNVIKKCDSVWKCWNGSVFHADGWNTLSLAVDKTDKLYAYLNGELVLERNIKKEDGIPSNGFVVIGTKDFGTAQFDDFSVNDVSNV